MIERGQVIREERGKMIRVGIREGGEAGQGVQVGPQVHHQAGHDDYLIKI